MPRNYPISPAWLEFDQEKTVGDPNPINTCRSCGRSFKSNSLTRAQKHLTECTDLRPELHQQYQPWLISQRGEHDAKRQKKVTELIDKMSEASQKEATQLLAEFFYGSGIPLSLASQFLMHSSMHAANFGAD